MIYEPDPIEAELEESGLMDRAQREREVTPFSRANLWAGALQGGGLAAILMAGHSSLAACGMAEARSRSAVFVALVLGMLLLISANRHPSRSVLAGIDASNPWLWHLGLAVLLLLVLVFNVPALRHVVGLSLPDSGGTWAATAMTTLSVVWLLLVWRMIAISRSPVTRPSRPSGPRSTEGLSNANAEHRFAVSVLRLLACSFVFR